MNLIIDAGNTRIKVALFEGRRMVQFLRLQEWELDTFKRVFKEHPINSVILSTVRGIPDELKHILTESCSHFFELEATLPLPVKLSYDTPETLGKDRIAAAAGAWVSHPGRNLLVIDAGTALTMDIISDEGVFEGGIISPGVLMRFRALHQFTGRLPLVEPSDDPPEIGKSTNEAIQAGVLNGIVYEVDNYINSLKNKYNGLTVILTGGDAYRLTKKLKNTIFVEPYLVLNGLNSILTYNE